MPSVAIFANFVREDPPKKVKQEARAGKKTKQKERRVGWKKGSV